MDNKLQQKVNVDLSMAETYKCSHSDCDSEQFVPNYILKKLSALVSPNGQETVIPIQVFACAKCGTIHDDFLPSYE